MPKAKTYNQEAFRINLRAFSSRKRVYRAVQVDLCLQFLILIWQLNFLSESRKLIQLRAPSMPVDLESGDLERGEATGKYLAIGVY